MSDFNNLPEISTTNDNDGILLNGGVSSSGRIDMLNNPVENLPDDAPQDPQDAATKKYVDEQVSSVSGGDGNTGCGNTGASIRTFGFQNSAQGRSSAGPDFGIVGFETVQTETFAPSEGVNVISGRVTIDDNSESINSQGGEPRSRIRISYDDGSTQTFTADDQDLGTNNNGVNIYASDTKRQPAITDVRFEYAEAVRVMNLTLGTQLRSG